jgi:hypothetical protein
MFPRFDDLDDLLVPSQVGVEIINPRPLHDRLIVRRFEEGEQKAD